MTTLELISFTSARPYLPAFLTTFMPTSEIEKRFIYANKLTGVPEETFIKRAEDKIKYTFESVLEIYGYTYLNQKAFQNKYNYLNYTDISVADINQPPPSKIQELISGYRNTPKNWKLAETAMYVYNGPLEKQLGTNLSADNNLKLIYKASNLEIHQIKPKN